MMGSWPLLFGCGRHSDTEEVKVEVETTAGSAAVEILKYEDKVFLYSVCGAAKGVFECFNTKDWSSRPGDTRNNSLWNHLVLCSVCTFLKSHHQTVRLL